MFLETIKANLLIILFFAAIVGVGFWAVNTLQVNPDQFDRREVNTMPVIETEPIGFGEQNPPSVQVIEEPQAEVVTTPESNQSTGLKGELEKLVTDNVLIKVGSKGTRVGTVQKFLNLYNNTNNSVDNDFGTGTENRLKDFQKKEGLTADGQAGPNTYKKMIEWIDKQ